MSRRTETSVPVIAETVKVGRRVRETERVKVRRRVAVDERVLELPVHREQLRVERVAVDRTYDQPPEIRRTEDAVVVPVVEEELVVQRRYRVREEIHVRTIATVETVRQPVRLRRHELDIIREPLTETTKETTMPKFVIAVYENSTRAEDAIRDLTAHGLRPQAIELADSSHVGPDQIMADLEERTVPHDQAELYAEAVRRGAAVVLADTPDDAAEPTAAILDQHGSIDIERSADRWRASGWHGYESGAAPLPERDRETERTELGHETFDVIQEEVRVGKRATEEAVRVRSFVSERPVTRSIELEKERIDVSRQPASEPLSSREAERAFEEGEIEVTAKSEEPVVEKQAHVVERVNVAKEAERRTETIEETERRRDIEVEREAGTTREPDTTRKP